jgi:hypothetical protein
MTEPVLGEYQDSHDDIRLDVLIERSSLGTPAARRLRRRVRHAKAVVIGQLADVLVAFSIATFRALAATP